MTRRVASDALIALRQAMKMTQAQFAVLVLDCAISTIGRYETTHPPQGDLLLRLAEVAKKESSKKERSPAELEIFNDLNGRFKELYIQDAREKLSFDLLMMPRTDTEPERAYVLTRVNGKHAIELANYFMVIKQALAANDIRKEAIEALAAMQKAVESIGGQDAGKAARLFPELMANPAKKNSPTPKPSRQRSKKQ